jgi:hypothetical protein
VRRNCQFMRLQRLVERPFPAPREKMRAAFGLASSQTPIKRPHGMVEGGDSDCLLKTTPSRHQALHLAANPDAARICGTCVAGTMLLGCIFAHVIACDRLRLPPLRCSLQTPPLTPISQEALL